MSGRPCKGFFDYFPYVPAAARARRRAASIVQAWPFRAARRAPTRGLATPRRSCRGMKSMTYRHFLSFSRNCRRNFWTFGATTNWQYGWVGFRSKYSWWYGSAT